MRAREPDAEGFVAKISPSAIGIGLPRQAAAARSRAPASASRGPTAMIASW